MKYFSTFAGVEGIGMGLPDDWHKVDGISDSQAYKCYGNAVIVNVIRDIMEKIIK